MEKSNARPQPADQWPIATIIYLDLNVSAAVSGRQRTLQELGQRVTRVVRASADEAEMDIQTTAECCQQ